MKSLVGLTPLTPLLQPKTGERIPYPTCRSLLNGGIVFLSYYLTAKVGLKIDAVSGFATLIWPPSGIALAVFLLGGFRFWPAIFFAAFLVNVGAGAPLPSALGIALGNTLEAASGAFLLTRFTGFRNSLGRINDVVYLVLIACVLSTAIGASVGVLSLWLGHVKTEGLGFTWVAWWIGDALGDLIIAPLLLIFGTKDLPKLGLKRGIEVFFLSVSLMKMNVILFSPFCVELGTRNTTLAYLLFPFIIWSALRFDQLGSTCAVFTIAVAAIWGTQQGYGPFSHGNLRENLFLLHSFISIVAVTAMAMAASVSERKRAVEDRKAAEEDLKKSYQRVERSVQVRDDFLSIASHELRTPLTSIYLQLQIIERMLKGANANSLEMQKLAQKINSSQAQAKQLGNLIDILLDVSRFSSGELIIEKEVLSLTSLTREIVAGFVDETTAVGGSLVFQDADEEIFACVDKLRVSQAITNLISNAIKYGACKLVEVFIRSDGKTARISVKDRGLGIVSQDQTRIFERFERAIPHHHISGMGLGLYITREVAQAHGGRVLLESEIHKGSIFVLELPLGHGSQQPPMKSPINGERSS